MTNLSIIANNICGGYEKKMAILNNISLEIPEYKTTAIVGPNGCGKTTLMKHFCRILKPWTGNILWNNKDIFDINPKEFAKKFSFVSQEFVPAKVYVYDYVSLGRIPYSHPFQFGLSRADKEKIEQSFSLTKTSHLSNSLVSEISGGEKQIIQITRALAQEPKVLFLDEPTAHLDIAHSTEIFNTLLHLKVKLSLTIIVVMHDLNLASLYSDNIIIMKNGTVVASGHPKDIFKKKLLEEVYETTLDITKHPIYDAPFVSIKVNKP